jgi:hypothetical protein
MCGLVRVRVKEDPFVSDTLVEELYGETDAKPLECKPGMPTPS